MRSRFMIAAPMVAMGVVVACGGSDTKRKAAPVDDGGADAASGGRPAGTGGRPGTGGAQSGGAPQAGGAPGAGGSPEAGPGDAGAEAEAGPLDASEASVRDVAPEAAPPPPPFQCVDGGNDVLNVFSCDSLDLSGAYFDPVAKTVSVEMPQGYRFDGVDFATSAVSIPPTVRIQLDYDTDAGVAGLDIDGRAPQVVGNRAVYSVPEAPDSVTSVRLTLHRVRDLEGRYLVGEAHLDFNPSTPQTDGGVGWGASACQGERPFGPPLAYECSEIGAVTYNRGTGELVLDLGFPGRLSHASGEVTRYVNGSPDTTFDLGPVAITGSRGVWQLGYDPSIVAVTLHVREVYGYCDAYYYGETVHRFVAPGGVDGGLPPPPDAAPPPAADAAVDEFWESSCSYEKFFWRF